MWFSENISFYIWNFLVLQRANTFTDINQLYLQFLIQISFILWKDIEIYQKDLGINNFYSFEENNFLPYFGFDISFK
jgi:hypothetical protein